MRPIRTLVVLALTLLGLASHSFGQGPVIRFNSYPAPPFTCDQSAIAGGMAPSYFDTTLNTLQVCTAGGWVAVGTSIFTNPLLLPDGSAGLPSWGWFSDSDGTGTGAYRPGPNIIRFVTNGISRLDLDSGGVTVASSGILSQAGANGDYWQRGSITEVLTLSTGAAFTDTTANLLPANSIIEAVIWRVNTAITTCASYSIGDATTAARFVSANTGVGLGSTGTGLLHWEGGVASNAAGPVQVAAAKLRVTCNVTPGAGAVRLRVFYRTFIPPTS